MKTITFDITDCNKRCWECSRDCFMKKMFLLPEQEFNHQIITSLKATAGKYIAYGGDPKIAENFVKEHSVTLAISRNEYIKKYFSK